jgi:adenine/guanine/hypoxanthine permease
MVRDENAEANIAAELYEVPDELWPMIRDSEPAGLYRGPVELADGRQVEGMLGSRTLVDGLEAVEITSFGGWRSYLASRE